MLRLTPIEPSLLNEPDISLLPNGPTFLSCTTFYERRAPLPRLPRLMDSDRRHLVAGGSDTIKTQSVLFFFFFFFFNTHRHFECVSVCVWFGLYFTVSGFIEKKRIPERAEKIKIKKLNKCATGVCHGVFCSFFLSLSMAQRLEIPPHVGKWNDT
jgi:hypothetical protein